MTRCTVMLLAAVMAILPEVESFAPVGKNLNRKGFGSIFPVICASAHSNDKDFERENSEGSTRRTALVRVLSSPFVAAASATALVSREPLPAVADASTADPQLKKQTNLSEQEILKIVVDQDLVANQFLVNGRLTRSVYDESCTFQDEIDTYGLEQWMKGTAKLFDGDRSKVVLVPGSVKTSGKNNSLLQFRFVEYLCFNIPVLKPIVYLSGTLFLERSESTGLITSYREKWDQDVKKVLTSESKLFTSSLSTESLDKDLDAFFAANANR